MAKIYQRACEPLRGGPRRGTEATCKRARLRSLHPATGRGEVAPGVDGCFRRWRRTGELTAEETERRLYPRKTLFLIRIPSASWRMHHPAAFSTALFHSGGVSRILSLYVAEISAERGRPGSCCQTPLGHFRRRIRITVSAVLRRAARRQCDR